MEIVQAQSSQAVQHARELFQEYAEWLDISLCFQNFDQELAELPGDYVPPSGRLLLAQQDGNIAGCVALRKMDESTCEMKRLFVRTNFRGQGLGRSLTESIIKEARQIGYERVRLDTLPGRMDRAIAMYRDLGFSEIQPYYNNPVPSAMFMELVLGAGVNHPS